MQDQPSIPNTIGTSAEFSGTLVEAFDAMFEFTTSFYLTVQGLKEKTYDQMTQEERASITLISEQKKYILKDLKWMSDTLDQNTNYSYAFNISLQTTPKVIL